MGWEGSDRWAQYYWGLVDVEHCPVGRDSV